MSAAKPASRLRHVSRTLTGAPVACAENPRTGKATAFSLRPTWRLTHRPQKGTDNKVAKYVTLYRWTDEGIRNVKGSPTRVKAGIQKAEAMGIKVLGTYYMHGEYDFVIIADVPDDKAGTALALAQAAQGTARSTTMRAYDLAEFEAIVK